MSNNGNGWKPREVITVTCPSGQKVVVQRPGPEFILRSGRVMRTFTQAFAKDAEAPTNPTDAEAMENYGLDVIEKMSDEELAAMVIFARDLIVTMVISPRIVLNPRAGEDEIGPDDIGNDFWFLFAYGMSNFVDLKVPIGAPGVESEVEVSDLSTFRDESSVSGDSVDGVHVSPDA